MEQVFEIGAAYRAEKHETNRHLNEYVSLDVETSFIESEADLIALEREILKHIFQTIREKFSTVVEEWDGYLPDNGQVDSIPSLTHDEAKKQISDLLGRRVFEINPEGERRLCEWAGEEHGVEAVFITAYPRKKRPFYTFPEGRKTRSFDLLFKGMEITTGGRRINRYDMLLEALPKFGLKEDDLADYLQIFRYGCPPHGGFAIGLERLTMNILGLQNVKEASLFPRDRKRIRP
jgi:nondiscriminating aspartyl-tRNA synthetase